MALRDTLRTHYEGIEKSTIALIFLGLLLSHFLNEQAFGLIKYLGYAGLWFLYFSTSPPDYIRVPLGLLFFYLTAGLFFMFDWEEGSIVLAVYYLAYPLFGGYIIFKSIRESLREKNFELLLFLMGLFIFLMPLTHYIQIEELEQAKVIFTYALAFVIATIMYNDNLWDRHSTNSKSVIKLIFIIDLLVIFSSAFKYLNI